MAKLFYIIIVFWFNCLYNCFVVINAIDLCPYGCNQDSCKYGLLFCSDQQLFTLPIQPPKNTKQVIITNQKFINSNLGYRNLSKYGPENIILQELTIQNCGIRDIESESFTHLIHLTMLDLSQNEIQLIRPMTFKALNLKVLKLNKNKLLKITKFSFQGLVVNHLFLSNCGLNQLDFVSIKEISGHLTKLDLSNNNLQIFTKRFFLIFRRLEELRLENNRLKCNCKLKWLGRLYQTMKTTKDKQVAQVACFYPTKLRGKLLIDLQEKDFQCPLPILDKLSVEIQSKHSAVLSCISTQLTDNHVSWFVKEISSSNGNHNNSEIELVKSEQQASISIYRKEGVIRNYFICLIKNDNGNISIDVSLTWPSEIPNRNPSGTSIPTTLDYDNKFQIFNKDATVDDNSNSYLFIKQFTLFELLLSIACTFVITIVLFSILYWILSRNCVYKHNRYTYNHYRVTGKPTIASNNINNSNNNNNNNNNTGIHTNNNKNNNINNNNNNVNGFDVYSTDSQMIYDIPHLTQLSYSPNHHNNNTIINNKSLSNNNNNNNTSYNKHHHHHHFQSSSPNLTHSPDAQTHLIDFKTQRLISPS